MIGFSCTAPRVPGRVQPGVMALGGGALIDAGNQELVRTHGPVVCLSASLETLQERLRSDAPNRPLLSGDLVSCLEELLKKRSEHYTSFSLQFRNEEFSLEQAAWNVQVLVGRFHVRGMGAGYDVWVIPGELDRLGQALSSRGLRGPVALVCDEHVGPLYAGRVLDSLRSAELESYMVKVQAGEQHKNIQTVQMLWEGLLQDGLGGTKR